MGPYHQDLSFSYMKGLEMTKQGNVSVNSYLGVHKNEASVEALHCSYLDLCETVSIWFWSLKTILIINNIE